MFDEPIEEQRQHIHFGHFGAILFCAVLLIGMTFLKGGFKFSLKSSGGHTTKQDGAYTYEQAKADVARQLASEGLASQDSESLANEAYKQLSLVDPNFGQGNVLGLSTNTLENLGLPKAEEILTPEFLRTTPVNVVNDSSLQAIENYKLQMIDPELENQTYVLIQLLSQDNSVGIDTERDKLLAMLLSIPVPEPLVEYHKLNMLYYFVLTEAYKESSLPADKQKESGSDAIFLTVSQRIAEIKSEIQTKYGVEL